MGIIPKFKNLNYFKNVLKKKKKKKNVLSGENCYGSTLRARENAS